MHTRDSERRELNEMSKTADIPRPVILNVVLLNLLHMVVRLRIIHSLGIFPRKVSNETQGRQNHYRHQPEIRIGQEDRKHVDVLRGKSQLGCDGGVDGQENEPNGERSGYGEDSVFGPHIGDERCLAENGDESGGV